MKYFKNYQELFIILLLSYSIILQSCHDCEEPMVFKCESRIGSFDFVEQMPQFPGGIDSLNTFLKQNLVYPEKSKQAMVEGVVKLNFIVNKYGNIECIKILKTLNEECDNESLRLINIMPLWLPAKHNGLEVNVSFTLEVEFKL